MKHRLEHRLRQRAVFLDRDGTLVHARHYPSRPEDLQLYSGIGPALSRIQQLGFPLVVITNQSALARGFFTTDDLERMHDYLRDCLAGWGVRLDAIYYCPHHPDGVVPKLSVRCDCRKPRPGMLLRAAKDLNISLKKSWMIGDILDDVEAGNRAGCRTILVDLGTEPPARASLRRPTYIARDTVHALRIIEATDGADGAGVTAETAYRPPSWRLAGAVATAVDLHDD